MTKQLTVTVLKGMPASGKSTWAKEKVAADNGATKHVNKDDFHAMLDGSAFSKQREKFVLEMRDAAVAMVLDAGYNVIVDDTNLHPKHLETIQVIADKLGAKVVVNDSFLKVPMLECIARDAKRPNPVGAEVIRRMARQNNIFTHALTADPYYVEGLEKVVICDLDGTLALMGSRNPYDASACLNDALNVPVVNYVRDRARHMPIFLFSGRKDTYRDQTEEWLKANCIEYHTLSMRAADDNRKDSIVKEEMFDKYIRGQYNVEVVLDDRDQVVKMWRKLGLNCWQVAPGNF